MWIKWAVCFSLVSFAVGANILCLMGVPSPSHHIWNRALMYSLAEKGHNLTIISADVEKNSENLHYIHLDNLYPTFYNGSEQLDFNELATASALAEVPAFYKYGTIGCRGTVSSKGFHALRNYPKDFKFDLVLHDFTIGPCLLGFMRQFNNPPLIGITAFNNPPFSNHMVGGHRAYAYTPYFCLPYDINMNFLQRAFNVLIHFLDELYRRHFAYPDIKKTMEKGFNEEIPDLHYLESMYKILLVNSHPAVDFPESFPPNIIPVGGMQIADPKPVPEDMAKFLESGKKGSVLFSIGSNFRSDELSEDKLNMFLEAFRQIPEYNFLWKFESDKLKDVPKNVMLKAWLPQGDILANENVKAFISHSGLLSTHEVFWRGVPLVSFPLYVDQHRNSFRAIQAGVGEQLDFRNLRTVDIVKVVRRVLENKRYAETMKVRSQQFRDQPEHPLQRAVWWVEYVLRMPNVDHIRSPIMELGFIRGNCLDILFAVLVVILLIVLIVKKVLCKVFGEASKQKRE